MDTWVAFPFWSLWIMLWSCLYKHLFKCLLGRLGRIRSATACPPGKCMFNLGAGTAALVSILRVCCTGVPPPPSNSRGFYFSTSSRQAIICPANQGHPSRNIFLCTYSLGWLVLLDGLHLLARSLSTPLEKCLAMQASPLPILNKDICYFCCWW